jgi:hypothetical protein
MINKQSLREEGIEAAARRIYELKGDRLGKHYVGWVNEPQSVKDEWLADVRVSIDEYESYMRLRVVDWWEPHTPNRTPDGEIQI